MSGPAPRGPVRAPSSRDEGAASRAIARRVLDRVAEKDAWATLTLDGELGRAGLDERDSRLCAELVYGVLRHRARLDRALAAYAELRRTPPRLLTVLRVAAYQLLMLDRVPAYAAVDDAVSAARAIGGAKLAGFANAVLRKLAAKGAPPLPAAGVERLCVEASLPEWILAELSAALDAPAELTAAALAFAEQAPSVLRCNTTRLSLPALIDRLSEEAVRCTTLAALPEALVVEGFGDPAKSRTFRDGLCTVQDASAQAVVRALAPRAGERVLDACAGVGGKATYAAELAGDAGHVDAVDLSETKLELLRHSAQRLGLRSIHTHRADLLTPALPAICGAYPKILLDAPCSGLGVLRRHPDAKWRQRPEAIEGLAALQARLLDAVVAVLAPGGTLVYSVCTFTAREGREQIRALLSRAPQLALEDEAQTWPHRDGGDAFYLAKLVRKT